MTLTVAIGGLGAIGLPVARALDRGVEGLRLIAVGAAIRGRRGRISPASASPPRLVVLEELAEADPWWRAAPAAVFEQIAGAAIAGGKNFVPSSVGALLPRMHLVEQAKATGRASSCRRARCSASMPCAPAPRAKFPVSRSKPETAARAAGRAVPGEDNIDVLAVNGPTVIFEGNAFDAAAGFPANVNVAAALALAGIGPADTASRSGPTRVITRNIHTIRVEARRRAADMTVENVPSRKIRAPGR